MPDGTFQYTGEVWINEYGITLGDAGARYRQQELSRQLGITWSGLANWHGVLRIRIVLLADGPPTA